MAFCLFEQFKAVENSNIMIGNKYYGFDSSILYCEQEKITPYCIQFLFFITGLVLTPAAQTILICMGAIVGIVFILLIIYAILRATGKWNDFVRYIKHGGHRHDYNTDRRV